MVSPLLLVAWVCPVLSSPHEYSAQTLVPLTQEQQETLDAIFGASGSYSGASGGGEGGHAEVFVETTTTYTPEVQEPYGGEVGVVNEAGHVAPDDYQAGAVGDLATAVVDHVFEHCEEYTESQGYECVPYYQCHNGTIITDGGGLIDIRNSFGILSPEDSKCPGFLDVCCQDPEFVPPPPPAVVQYSPRCGRRHQNGLGVRIQGFTAHEAQFGEWPHMCAVLEEQQAEGAYGENVQAINLYQCGGSLVAPGVILTAAHCAAAFQEAPSKLKVRCGEWDTQDTLEPREHQDRHVAALAIHPEFDPRSLANDWALLFTSEEFDLQEHVDTVCLPDPDESFDYEEECFATGWGKDEFGAAGQYQVVLKEIDLPMVAHNVCEASLRTTRLGHRFQLDESFVCAGGVAGKDTCKGDGGGPLVCPSKVEPGAYVQAGIVAWGIGCGEDNVPGVYAAVAKGVCWMDVAMSCQAANLTLGVASVLGLEGSSCQAWLEGRVAELVERVAAMDTAHLLSGRARAAVFAEGFQAQHALDAYTACSVDWSLPTTTMEPSTQPSPYLAAVGTERPLEIIEDHYLQVEAAGQPYVLHEESLAEPEPVTHKHVDPYHVEVHVAEESYSPDQAPEEYAETTTLADTMPYSSPCDVSSYARNCGK